MITGVPDDYPVADLPAWTRTLQAMIRDSMYPIGFILAMGTSDSPGDTIGGTWTPIAPGRVLVGIDHNDNDFNTAGETGGTKAVTLTAAQSGMVAHWHTMENHTHSGSTAAAGAHWHNVPGGGGAAGAQTLATNFSGHGTNFATDVQGNHAHSFTTGGPSINSTGWVSAADATAAHTNLQPYLVVHYWQRTA